MKKLFFALAFFAASSVVVLAQDTASVATQDQSNAAVQEDDKGKQAIATSELPASIQTTLQGQDYTGWTVANAYKKDKDGKTMYSVEMTKGTEKKMVKFDADGNVLKEKD